MNASKQIRELISEHLDLAKMHKEKAELLMKYLDEPVNANVSGEEIIKPSNADENVAIASPKKNVQAQILFTRNPKVRTMKEWQELYSKVIGNPEKKEDITMTIRLLKMKNITAKKDYGNNQVKWGLSKWYDSAADDFKLEFK